MKEPLIISSEFEWLNDVISKVESDRLLLRKVICFMMYYGKPKSGKITRTGVKRAILDVFNADAYKQRQWMQSHWTRKQYPPKTYEEVDALLSDSRFREYDAKALEVMKSKYEEHYE